MSLDAAAAVPPVADRAPHARTHHGDTVIDPYHWLSIAEDPRVRAHLEAENAYTDAVTAPLGPLTERLFDEQRARTQETDVSVPVRKDGWWYFGRTTEGHQYGASCRVPDTGSRPEPVPGRALPGEQVVLDAQAEAAGHEHLGLGGLAVDPAGTRVAIARDVRGDERFDVVVREIADGRVVDEAVRGAGYGLAWSADGTRVFYTRVDDAWRSYQVWCHEIGSDAGQDRLVLQEDDEMFVVGFHTSRDDRWLVLQAGSRTTSQAWLLDLTDAGAQPVAVHPREPGLDYDVEIDDDRVLVVHNGAHQDFELAWAPLATPGREHWRPLVTGGEGDRILEVSAFTRFAALTLRHAGLPALWLLERTPDGYAPPRPVEPPQGTGALHLGATLEADSPLIEVVHESWTVPASTYDLDPGTGELTLVRRKEVPGLDPGRYAEQRLWVTARDGAQVPVSLVHHVDVTPDGSAPGLLYGYGSYEISLDPAFSTSRLSLLDRGVVCAVAHVRGGGELGRGWYDDGKMLRKGNTFTDFVDCSRALVDQGWVHPDRLAAEGGSAGGLLVGAAINEDPGLYRFVHAAVPFVDALTTILDPELPLTVGEWEEWGNPLADPEVYACMKAYTPYENIRPVRYPTVLATSSLHDTRVFVAEPAKWVQALRATTQTDPQRPVLLRVEMGGHGGRSGRYDAWRQVAFEHAVMLDALGAAEPLAAR